MKKYFCSHKYPNWICEDKFNKLIFEEIISLYGEVYNMNTYKNVCIVTGNDPIVYKKEKLITYDYLVFIYASDIYQMTYQLSHEIAHIITNCQPETSNKYLLIWSEGLACAASYYITRRLSDKDASWNHYYNKAKQSAKIYHEVLPSQQLEIAEEIYNNKSGWKAIAHSIDWDRCNTLCEIKCEFILKCTNNDEKDFIEKIYNILSAP